MDEVDGIEGWNPTTIYEPIPDRCVPEELPALRVVFPKIDILSPNAVEALSILSMPVEKVTKAAIEDACSQFLAMGVGREGKGAVIIRSGELGAYVKQMGKGGLWVDAYWGEDRPEKVVDVTGKRRFESRTIR
jgi:sugar/nucleoside kinase (ribokinase family)